jgi:hypothetical protein
LGRLRHLCTDLVVAVRHTLRPVLGMVSRREAAFDLSKKMKDLVLILGVFAFVLIIPAIGWISSRLEAARNRKRDQKLG